ncbi:hypothetical protein [Caldalkalibacillus salinus]|uniref:hypothetical protein n=1 Tax=Caldalkalibacillus salinus TaxID=2803787 RepID=UPI001921FF8E|nr:hypothetical protein [Caldalkalibacillus salinus]
MNKKLIIGGLVVALSISFTSVDYKTIGKTSASNLTVDHGSVRSEDHGSVRSVDLYADHGSVRSEDHGSVRS